MATRATRHARAEYFSWANQGADDGPLISVLRAERRVSQERQIVSARDDLQQYGPQANALS